MGSSAGAWEVSLMKTGFSFPSRHQFSIVGLMTPPSHILGFFKTWSSTCLVHTVKTNVNTCVQLPCCDQKTLTIGIYYCWFIQSFCPLFYCDSWALERACICLIQMSCLELNILESVILSSLTSYWFLLLIAINYTSKPLWWRLRDVLIYGYKDKFLGTV